ncbi:hypothetical protein [Paraburkholderia sp. ZP32-5]|uniref:hypothetical protein n=1 Tax=Paraburkholderia sp. ZP32-5 TaxID=2883245 RepID=UPI001F3229D3|nr:hypothetical protein [Paraburkholderia sp. ZP32-5]
MNKIVRLFHLLARLSGVRCRVVLCGPLVPSLMAIAGCSTAVVYDQVGKPSGSVESLAGYIPSTVTDIKLVFLHGVGDHCPGYALSGGTAGGWFDDKKAAKLGLTPIDPEPTKTTKIYSDEFLSTPDGSVVHPFDNQSYVALRTQNFTYGTAKAHVEAIEITWSPLTQWIKNRQLVDDYTEKGNVSCNDDLVISGEIDPVSGKPPPRLAINRVLKEDLLDRNLADAAIYMGQYHSVMQLGVADALCHALTGQPVVDGQGDRQAPVCDWNKATVAPHTGFIFVTHSLGGRLLYDTLLGLMDLDAPGVDRAALATEFPRSSTYMSDVMSRTPVVYMMANQLSFLGMANTTAQDTSDSIVDKPAVDLIGQQDQGQDLSLAAGVQGRAQAAIDRCVNVGCRLSVAKQAAVALNPRGHDDPPSEQLSVVAFSDTDDLLTWPVPSKYQRDAGNPQAGKILPLKFINVYVDNATRWLFFEWPPSAHDDYFINGAVWNVIHCGAYNGQPKECY